MPSIRSRQTVKAIGLFELREFEPLMQQLGDIILQSAQKTAVIGLLGTMKEAERLNALTQEKFDSWKSAFRRAPRSE